MRQIKNTGQQGSALLMCMVFLLVLSLLGVAAMRAATMEEVMAANSQTAAYLFQQVQSEISQELRALNTDEGQQFLQSLDYHQLSKQKDVSGAETARLMQYLPATASVALPIQGNILGGGFYVQHIEHKSLRFIREGACADGSSLEHFVCSDFELEVSAKLDNGMSSSQVQGFTWQRLSGRNEP